MSLDVFRGRAFHTTTLTDHVGNMPYVPMQLRDLGIFAVRGVRTRSIYVTQRDGKVELIPTSTIGAPPEQYEKDMRDAINFRTSRLAKGDRVAAEEVQGVLADGSETQLKNLTGEVNERLVDLRRDMELTKEHMRLGAINGVVVDAKGVQLADYYGDFAVTRPDEIGFSLETASLSGIAKSCLAVLRHMETEGGAELSVGAGSVVGLCGATFWEKLIAHQDVIDVYARAANAAAALDRSADQFTMNGIRFVRYRGTDDGTTASIPADKVRFVPAGTDAFRELYAPAEFAPYVNQRGLAEYAMVIPDEKRQAHVDVELYSYPLMLCQRPRMLISGAA